MTRDRGPLVLVHSEKNRYVKMYKQDAIDQHRTIASLTEKRMDKKPFFPMMYPPEIAAFEKLLVERAPTKVLEWGSGSSTLYWPPKFPNIQWLSIEHQQFYANFVRTRASPNVLLLHLGFPEYYELPNLPLQKFDLILVDGRQRVKCLAKSRYLLSDQGIVVLHDVWRERYSPAKEIYNKLTVLVPPAPVKDPRGLWMLEEPNFDWRPDGQ